MEIWLASLDDVDLKPARAALSAAELARAETIASEQRRRRFLARRWVARTLLARETGGDGSREVWWSATSSAGLAALAIVPRRVGLDLEKRAERPRREAIARRFYSERERRAVAGSATRFLEFWTLKEAYLKALGQGLPGGLDSLDCASLAPAADGWSASAEHPGWHFRNVEVDPGFVAALAIEGEPEAIRPRDWAEISPGSR